MKPIAFLLVLNLTLNIAQMHGQEEASKQLDLSSAAPTSGQVIIQTDPADPTQGVSVTMEPGPEGYPGVKFTPKGYPVWNLSAFGHVEAKITNLTADKLSLTLRVDNTGDWKSNPWNAEKTSLKGNETKTVSVVFGYSFGGKPGFALKPAEISNIMIFADKSEKIRKFRVDSIKAAGPAGQKPAEDPRSIRIKPVNGVVLTPKTQIEVKDGAKAEKTADGKGIQVAVAKGQSVLLKPEAGQWDLRDGNQIRLRVKNTGSAPVSPRARLNSRGGPTSNGEFANPVKPGASADLIVSFIPPVPWKGIVDPKQETKVPAEKYWEGQPGTGTKFMSDAVAAIELLPSSQGTAETFQIESIIVEAPAVVLPDWVGQRPPVEGDWVKTFSDEFDGDTIDLSKWNIYTENYWDKKTHFSKDNVIVGGGKVKLRYEKKRGKHNDKPDGKETDYACGFLSSYGKWVQRYGYFEARMKLPKAPGLWPGFWTMPDRGLATGPQWKRADTAKGGMEFDILENLTRWGTYRFNIAFHWDGYGKNHQAMGSSNIYAGHDKEGFITAGLLWLPGLAVYYCNGAEVARWETARMATVESYPIFYQVSGGWDNNSLDDKQLPADFEVDYIRVWQRKDLASPVDGVRSTQRTPAPPTTPDP